MAISDERIRNLSLEESGRDSRLSRAYLILQYAHDSAHALLGALRTVRRERGAERGALTDEEQDLLRAMLVMAASGLDALTKQLLRDALPYLCKRDEKVRTQFQKYIERKLKGEEKEEFLLFALTSGDTQQALIERYVDELTGSSLQSVKALSKAVNALGLSGIFETVQRDDLQTVFRERNTSERDQTLLT